MMNTYLREGQSGTALILTMLVLMILSILGVSALNSTDSELKIVRKNVTSQQSFFIAESGLEHAKMYLTVRENRRNINNVIENHQLRETLGDGEYNVRFRRYLTITTNIDEAIVIDGHSALVTGDDEAVGTDGEPTGGTTTEGRLEISDISDTEAASVADVNLKIDGASLNVTGINFNDVTSCDELASELESLIPIATATCNPDYFDVISTGTMGNSSKIITLRIEKDISDIDIDAAFSIHTPTPNLEMKGNPLISGYEYELPPNDGVPKVNGIEIPAIYSENEFGVLTYEDKHLEGTINTGESSYGNTSQKWIDFAESVIPYADRYIDPGSDVPGNAVWGDQENPEITIVDNRKLSGTISGAGVLILKKGADITGNFNFSGIVVYLLEEGDKFEMFSAGTPQIIGSIAIAGFYPPEEIIFDDDVGFKGNASVKYSPDALDLARNAIGPSLNVISWSN